MNDQDDLARRLLAPLAGEPAGPSTVDIRRAMAEGRRRLRTRRVAGVSVAAAVTALVAAGVPVALDRAGPTAEPPPALTAAPSASPTATGPVAPARCELEDLPVPDDAYQSLAAGGDPTGRFILGLTYFWDAPAKRVVVWDDGELITVDMPGDDPGLDDINSNGVGVGTSYPTDETRVSWLYRDGAVRRLPDGYHAISINEQGAIAGSVGPAVGLHRPAVLRSPTADPEELSVPGPSWDVTATDVDADGTVVGSGQDMDLVPNPPSHGFVWMPDGTRRQLPAPFIDGDRSGGFLPDSIRDGVVTGLAIELLEDDVFTYRLFAYELRTGEFTDLSGHAPFVPDAWNAQRWLVGHTGDELLLQAGPVQVPLPYPELPDNPEDQFLNLPTVALLTDDGRTIVGDVRVDEVPRVVVWRCE